MVALEVPAALSFRYLAMHAAAVVARRLGQPVEFVDQVRTAVGEAFNNAVFHAGGADSSIEIEIELDERGAALLVRVRDYGSGFTLNDDIPLPDFDPLEISDLPEGGMGLFLIRALMSDVTYEPGHPNVLSMRKVLVSAAPAGAAPSAGAE